MTQPVKILFVDDDPLVLQGLRRALYRQHKNWNMVFAEDADTAFAILNEEPADVIVSDLRMPGMDGMQFLERVAGLWPSAVRIILTGQTEREALLRSIGPAPQFLSKPCSAEKLEDVISRSIRLRNAIQDPDFLERIGGMKSIPSPPDLYTRLMEAIRNDKTPIGAVGKIVSEDVSFSARLLQIANSPIFALPITISDASHAVRLLGIDTVRGLALNYGLLSSVKGMDLGGLPIEELWFEGVQCGAVTRHIAMNMRATTEVVNESALAGMLHGIGQVLLAMNDPRRHRAARAAAKAGQLQLCEAEKRLFGFNHSLAGGYLLQLWGLPEAIVEGVIGWPYPSKLGDMPAKATTADYIHIARLAMKLDQKGSDLLYDPDDLIDLDADLERMAIFGANTELPKWIRNCPHLGHGTA